MDQKVINPWKWQDDMGFVQATEITNANKVLYCSGQTSVDADGRPVHAADMRAQINQAMDNLETVLTQAKYNLSNIARLNYYTTDVDLFFENFDALMSRLSKAGCRACGTLLGVSRLAFPELLIEIEATAVK